MSVSGHVQGNVGRPRGKVQKASGDEEPVDAGKAARSMVAAGCSGVVAEEIAADMPGGSTEDLRDHITAEMLRRGETAAASRYRSYHAGFSPAAIRVLKGRYLQRRADGQLAESPAGMLGRVSVCMAMPELGGEEPPVAVHGFGVTSYNIMPYASLRSRRGYRTHHDGQRRFSDAVKRYHALMMERKFLPNSPTLMNAGAQLGQLSACFVLDIPDTLDGILDTTKNTGIIFKSGGGVGINYSSLRPAGSRVGSAAGAASGPLSFMGLIDRVGDVIKQGGRRRAANMGVLDASHPDIREFIHAKRTPGVLENFNVSVGTDAKFWECVESGAPYHGIDASALLDEIAGSAHASAEPGVIFFDNINKHNVLKRARGGPLRSTNPCWGGETRVLTKDGPVSFRELHMGQSKVKVMTREEDGSISYRTMENPGLTAQGAEVMCLVVESEQGGEPAALRCTPTHKVYVVTASGVEKRAVSDLKPGMSLASLYLEGSNWEQTVGVSTPVNEVPEIAMQGTGHPTPGILPISLMSRKKGKAKKKRAHAEGFVTPEGDVPENAQPDKPGMFSRMFGRKNHKVLSVFRVDDTDVYNGMVETTHNYFVECGEGHYILSGNCGEQALYPNESCNLGSINLAEYVDEDELDWEALEADTRTCTRMLDGVVDMTRHPTPDIEIASNETRRVGLGVMGVADMLMYLGVPYNTPEAYRLFGQIAEFVSYHSMAESVRLAVERGPFPLYGESAYVDGMLPFVGDAERYRDWEHRSTMPWDELLSNIQKHGIRNVLTTTIAPTGTISMIAGCSSGIEPLFSLTYTKEVSLGVFNYGCPALEAKHPDVLDEVSAAGGVMPDGLVQDAAVFVTARQTHWADHILAQAAWQRWIGNSISKTINMAAGCTVRDVRDAYVLAHSLGCRGITVYRDGSRDKQVLKSGDALGDPVPSDAAAGCMA